MDKTRHVIAFISAKGGSGKTVTASSIGRFVARLGYRTLLVDTDAATNGLTLLFLPTVTRSKAMRSQFKSGVFDSNGVTKPKVINIQDNLDLLPATYTMAQTEDVSIEKFESTLRNTISQLVDYDIILLDAQAGANSFAKVAASLADQVVIVTEFDPISFQGVDRLKILFSSVIDPSSTWILYNKILPEFATAIGEGLIFAQVLPPIPWDVDVVRAFAQRELAINMDDPNPYTFAISQIISRLFDNDVRDSVKKWMTTTEQSKIRPIVDRLEYLETDIGQLEKEKISIELRLRTRRRVPVIIAQFLGLFGFIAAFSGIEMLISDKFSATETLAEWIGNVARQPLLPIFLGMVVGVLPILIWWLTNSQRGEQRLLEQEQFISRRIDDINEERRRLKVTADAVTRIAKP